MKQKETELELEQKKYEESEKFNQKYIGEAKLKL